MKRVSAKKHLGQHFLNDKSIAVNLINQIDLTNKNILEIGPGMGRLTQFLLMKDLNLKVIEIDKESIFYLRLNYPKLNIIDGDFLKINLQELFEENITLIGNFPYNISSQILFKTYENRDKITQLVGMFQKEVAERIYAINGRKKGILSVLIQTFYNVEYCFTVQKHVFTPPPKVESGVIKLIRNNKKKLDCNEKIFIQIIKAGYNQRRKTLKNALKSFTLKTNNRIKILLQKRAEELEVEDFITITKYVEK